MPRSKKDSSKVSPQHSSQAALQPSQSKQAGQPTQPTSVVLETPAGYAAALEAIKTRIRTAQVAALRAVNRELVNLYWEIGKLIVERQQGETWGQSVVEQLAADIRAEFPGLGGFSAANIWRMRNFYATYRDHEKLAPMVREISWSHNLAILEKCRDKLEREFYLRMTRKFGWSKNVLIHQIESHSYERTLASQTNFEQTLAELMNYGANCPRPNKSPN